MHKDKKGNVIASLTEVKNKTGDIFDLVDEFGEVVLTSYNKPRYKIVKIGIAEVLNIQEEEKPVIKESITKKVKEMISGERKKTEIVEVVDETEELIDSGTIEKFKQAKWWDSKSSAEKNFIKTSKKPLVK